MILTLYLKKCEVPQGMTRVRVTGHFTELWQQEKWAPGLPWGEETAQSMTHECLQGC